jgi:hypothetical protein
MLYKGKGLYRTMVVNIGKELARYCEDPHSIDKTCAKVTHEITPHQFGLLPQYM